MHIGIAEDDPHQTNLLRLRLEGAQHTVIDRGAVVKFVDLLKKERFYLLLARVAALGQRVRGGVLQVLRLGAFEIDIQRQRVLLDGEAVVLIQREFDLSAYLFQNPGKLLSRDHLLSKIWGINADVDTRAVDTNISRLRKNPWQRYPSVVPRRRRPRSGALHAASLIAGRWCLMRAGTPTANAAAGTSHSTTALAPMAAPPPMHTGPKILAPAPMPTPFFMLGCSQAALQPSAGRAQARQGGRARILQGTLARRHWLSRDIGRTHRLHSPITACEAHHFPIPHTPTRTRMKRRARSAREMGSRDAPELTATLAW